MLTEDNKIEALKHLLLDTDLDRLDKIDVRLREVASDLYIKERLQVHVEPIIIDKLDQFQETIPDKLGPSITAALKKQVKDSQGEVVDALYPLLGKLISRYIKKEMELISQKIDEKFQNAFTWEAWKRRIKGWVSGTKESELLMQELMEPTFHELFMIEKGSGLLLGKYAKDELLDADMISGMLTAIKSFVEDAFKSGSQQLESIDYDDYKIKIFNYGSFYIAVVISGVENAKYNARLQLIIDDFIEFYLHSSKNSDNSEKSANLLKTYFDELSI